MNANSGSRFAAFKRGISTLLAVALVTTLISPLSVVFAADDLLHSFATGDILIQDTATQLVEGVTEHKIITNNAEGTDQKIDFFCEVKPSDTVKIVAGYGENDASGTWSLVQTSKQAAAYEADNPGHTVVAAINADFFNMATGEPIGPLVMEGNVVHGVNGRNYFGITKDGTPVIRNGSVSADDCRVAVGGDMILVKDGVNVATDAIDYGNLDYSRTGIGIKEDGTVILYSSHGRLYPVSCGRTYEEMADMFVGAGCVAALALDGGGSATYCGRPEGSDTLEVRNSPSDGAERAVSSSLLVVSLAESTGVFDHAALAPNKEVYTPNSTVQFTARGVDGAGVATELPEGATWALAEDSAELGTIDQTGLFTANNNTGVVNVEMLLDGEVVGTTSIEIATPDEIYFASEEVSLGFEEVTDLGIVVRSKGRTLNYNVGDLVWTSTNDKMGTFDGNMFIASDGESLNGNITATSAYDETVSGTLHVIVGMLPTLVWDFEDVTDAETGNVTAAEDYYVGNAEAPGILSTSNYGRGGQQSIEIVSIDDEEPVRFGSKSLKLNYDFTQCGAVTEGACVGTTAGMSIPGTPTGIGVWVYAPEGVGIEWKGEGTQAGLWLRGYVRDSAGNNMPYDFTFEPKKDLVMNSYNPATGKYEVQPGIYWEGWHYLEADLTSMSAPFSIQPGMTFRLMFVAGTNMGTRSAGSLYFDNLQFVYGTNIDDVDNPIINTVNANGEKLENGTVLDTNVVNFEGIYSDVQNKYTSGINPDTIRMYIDGVNVVGNDNFEYAQQADGSMSYLYNVLLLDGEHSFTVSVRDNFGNETSETIVFTVEGDGTLADVPTVEVAPLEEAARLGDAVNLEILTSDPSVDNIMTSLRLGNAFTDYEVNAAEGYDVTTSYNKITKVLTINAVRKAEAAAAADTLVATATVAVPADLTRSAEFTYEVKAGSYTVGEQIYTFSAAEEVLPVEAFYVIEVPTIIVGQAATLTVLDAEGTPAAGIDVCLQDGTVVGTTDENGQLTTEDFSAAAGTYVIYAADAEGRVSFQDTIFSYDSQGADLPYNVMLNASVDGTTQQNISWMSGTASAGQQTIKYAPVDSEEWVTVPAEYSVVTFEEGNKVAVTANRVLLTNLIPGTEYQYQLGYGETWTEVDTFTTGTGTEETTNFFVIADTQGGTEKLDTLLSQLQQMNEEQGFDFAIQTGDAVDPPDAYAVWEMAAQTMGEATFGDVDFVHTMGNHEYDKDSGVRAQTIFNTPVDAAAYGSTYSVEYGNVYVAVLDYTATRAQLKASLEWLVEDAQKSEAAWKVLSIHQPPYYTNSSGGNDAIYELVPDAAEEAGIDVVFSGHDHSIARTKQLLDEEVDLDNGILYYIGGGTESGKYSIRTDLNWDLFDLAVSGKNAFNATYITASADADKMKIDIYDIGDGTAPVLMDTYTIEKVCSKYGHEYDCYDPESGMIVCAVCGAEKELGTYTGFLTDINGEDAAGDSQYYFLAGNLKTGFFMIGDTYYYANEAGLIDHTTVTYSTNTCTAKGSQVVHSLRYDVSTVIAAANYTGHNYEEQADGSLKCVNELDVFNGTTVEKVECGHIAIDIADWNFSLRFTTATYDGSAKQPAIIIENPETGETLKFATDGMGRLTDYTRLWSNNVAVGTATVTIDANPNGNYTNSNGPVVLELRILPAAPVGLVAEPADTSVTLTWSAPAYATKYIVYNGDTVVGETSELTYTVDGLNADQEYTFKVRSVVELGDEVYTGAKVSEATTKTGAGISIADAEAELNWTKTTFSGTNKCPGVQYVRVNGVELVNGTDFRMFWRNNTDAGTAEAVIDGIGAYSGQKVLEFTINPQELSDCTFTAEDVTLEIGAAQVETTVTGTNVQGDALVEDTDYTVVFEDNTAAGKGKAVITGMGNYTGTVTVKFNIKAEALPEQPGGGDDDQPSSGGTGSTGGGMISITYRVKFDANGGTCTTKSLKTDEDGYLEELPTAVREGYVFDGWYTAAEGGEKITLATAFEKHMTVYAHWSEEGFSCDGGADCPAHDFADTGKIPAWAHEGIDYVVENGLMNGMDGKFEPYVEMTRGMLVTILYRMEGEPAVQGKNPYTDVAEGMWYTKAVMWANEAGIVNGVAADQFAPNGNITREQIATMLWRYAQYKGVDVSVGEETNILSYDDALQINDWAMSAMQWACGDGLVQGVTESTLDPQSNAIRAQVATLLMRYLTEIAE